MKTNKDILHTENYKVDGDSIVRIEYYDDGTYSAWLDDKQTVVNSKWEIRDGRFWFKHPELFNEGTWETTDVDNHYYERDKRMAEILESLLFLRKVIEDDKV